MYKKYSIIFFLLSICLITSNDKVISSTISPKDNLKDCEAIVLGKIIKKKIIKLNNYYLTEYKLKIKNWIFKKPHLSDKKRILTLRILGADFPRKGITIKASTSPDYIPFNTSAIFVIKNTKQKQKNIFTLSRDSIINPSEEKYITYLLKSPSRRNICKYYPQK